MAGVNYLPSQWTLRNQEMSLEQLLWLETEARKVRMSPPWKYSTFKKIISLKPYDHPIKSLLLPFTERE